MTGEPLTLCIIGAGPRGVSVLERLCANERAAPSRSAVTVHLVDPFPPGAGAVWRTDQSRQLLMNTVSSQITLFTDEFTRIEGPVEAGPTLFEWARALRGAPGGCGQPEQVLAEADGLGPDDYPTRAFYGAYLHDSFRQVVARAPGHVSVRVHATRAVAVVDTHGTPGGPQSLRLADGSWIGPVDAVVLAQGHVPVRPTPAEERAAELAHACGLHYITPANPADLDLSGIKPGENVLLRGLGLNFFDHMALLTVGRGGTFVRDQERNRLVYRPSGREPRLLASSRRGVPYHSRGENEKGAYGRHRPALLTAEYAAGLRERTARGEQVRFGTDLWPLITREVESVYYGTLLCGRGRRGERDTFTEKYLALTCETDRAALLDAYGIAPRDRWDWERLSRPTAGHTFAGPGEFRDWLLAYLARDVEQARAGNVTNPLKAALDVLRDLRNEIRIAVDHGGLDGDSHRDELEDWYTPLNAFLSIGPPVSRIEEMMALLESGILVLTGPGTEIRIDTDARTFVAVSRSVPGPPVRANTLIEARLPVPDLRRTGDPLLAQLFSTGQAAAFRIRGAGGSGGSGGSGGYETGGLAVTERPYRVLDAQGLAHPRRFAYGIPTESVHWVTAAGIRPGVDSVTLGDSDAIARSVLSLAPTAVGAVSARRPAAEPGSPTGVVV